METLNGKKNEDSEQDKTPSRQYFETELFFQNKASI